MRFLQIFFYIFFAFSFATGQQGKDLFDRKVKRKAPSSVKSGEQIIDGSLSRRNIFNASPLFKLSNDKYKIVFGQGSHTPIWIESKLQAGEENFVDGPVDINSLLASHFRKINHLARINNPIEELEIISVQQEPGSMHIRLQQKYKGISLYGCQLYAHFTKKSTIVNGRYLPSPGDLSVNPRVSRKTAIASAVSDLQKEGKFRELSETEKKLLDYKGPEAELIFYSPDMALGKIILAWKIEVRPDAINHWEYVINASDGKIEEKSNHTCTGATVSSANDLNGNLKTFGTYLIGSTYYLIDAGKPMFNSALSTMPNDPVGAIWTIDADNTDLTTFKQITSASINTWNAKAVSAHFNADSCYRYFSQVHSRNSLDGKGNTIISVINVTMSGQQMDNAYWNGKFMAYGNGDFIFKPLAGSLDVAAHEMTHGVIQHSANLNYKGQSGAINESMADIFGCMVDRDDWHIGEDIMAPSSAPYYPSGYLRDLSDPHNGGTSSGDYCWQPKHMNEFVFTAQDNGGVHINSGIPNHAYYLFATAVGKSTAEQVFYRALTKYLLASSQFIDLRLAVVQSATDLYPSNSAIADAARSAFDQVGILDGAGTVVQNDLPVNPGSDFLLVRGAGDPVPLYKITPSGFPYTAISSADIICKPSITDNGATAYFADAQGRIIRKNIQTNVETVADNSRTWANVAVSKDGIKLAAVTDEVDSAIYVRPVSASAWTKFKLYNPTFTPGIKTSGPQFADAMEWDYSGEQVMFDCYNLTVGNNNDTIDYWSIGFLKAWDNSTNSVGDGSIKNLFDGLPTYINIGNPSFAKNSRNIIAFDMIDYSYGDVTIVGTDIESGNSDFIVDLNLGMLGYPTFSKLDNKVAFTSFDVFGDTSIFTIGLNPDKISYSDYSTIAFIFERAKAPVWYATGTRVITGNFLPQISFADLTAYPNPFADELSLEFRLENSTVVNIELLNMLGQPVKTLYSGKSSAGDCKYDFSLKEFTAGSYMIRISAGEQAGVVKVVKVR
jgi:Zn-dependent metalloprotease